MMELYAVWRRRESGWKEGEPIEAQDLWAEHATFMMKGAGEGRVVLAGPVDDSGALIIVRGESPEEVEAWLAEDPWTASGLLVTERIAQWRLRIGSLP
jgi:uncharacterized protein YciI